IEKGACCMTNRLVPGAVLLVLSLGSAFAQDFAPPPSNKPDDAVRKQIAEKTEKLGKELTDLRRLGVHDPVLAEIEIFHKAAVWIVRHDEFFHKDAGDWTLKVLDRGLLRAAQAAYGESPWLHQSGRTIVRAYRSQLDGS